MLKERSSTLIMRQHISRSAAWWLPLVYLSTFYHRSIGNTSNQRNFTLFHDDVKKQGSRHTYRTLRWNVHNTVLFVHCSELAVLYDIPPNVPLVCNYIWKFSHLFLDWNFELRIPARLNSGGSETNYMSTSIRMHIHTKPNNPSCASLQSLLLGVTHESV